MRISYNSIVYTAAGWRHVYIEADAEQISAGMARVTRVISIDGDAPHYGMSRTGAKRQSYNGNAVAAREVGAKKRLSSCNVSEAA
jgi:hypothetical protein